MNLTNPFTDFSLPELFLLGIFVIYLVFPVNVPIINDLIASPIGFIVIFIVSILLFLYTNPILAILYIFVAYELLRRSSNKQSYRAQNYVQDNTVQEYNYVHDPIIHDSVNHQHQIVEHMEAYEHPEEAYENQEEAYENQEEAYENPEEAYENRDERQEEFMLPVGETLEESTVRQMAPIDSVNSSEYSYGDFSPIRGSVNASVY